MDNYGRLWTGADNYGLDWRASGWSGKLQAESGNFRLERRTSDWSGELQTGGGYFKQVGFSCLLEWGPQHFCHGKVAGNSNMGDSMSKVREKRSTSKSEFFVDEICKIIRRFDDFGCFFEFFFG